MAGREPWGPRRNGRTTNGEAAGIVDVDVDVGVGVGVVVVVPPPPLSPLPPPPQEINNPTTKNTAIFLLTESIFFIKFYLF